MSVPALRARGLSVRFGERAALEDLNLEQAPGEMVGVLGATGAGKSTLLACASRIVPEMQPATVEGRLEVFGRDVAACRVHDLAGAVGLVLQDFEAQLFSTRVRDEICFGPAQLGVDPGTWPALKTAVLAQVGLSGFEERDPLTLSGGEKQRLALAAVLAMRPGLLLLDEVTTDLDPLGRDQLFTVLGEIRRGGAAILAAEHELERILAAARWVVLDRGRIALAGPPERLIAAPEELRALGIRPPELATFCAATGLPAWPLDVDAVADRARAAGIFPSSRPPSSELRATSPERGERRDVLVEACAVRHRHPGSTTDALARVDLAIGRGEFVALLGRNGSGKSTLARILAGLVEPSAGEARLHGRRVRSLRARERVAVGYVFQNPDDQLFAATVEDEVAFGPRQLGLASEEIEKRVRSAIEGFGLRGLEGRDPFVLGKGERQRVAIASILALEPDVLILDEPTTGLDAREQADLMERLAERNREGMTLVVVTHVPWVVTRFARRALVLDDGGVAFDGSVRELCAREDLCRRGRFVPPESVRLGRLFGVDVTTVEELLSLC